MNIVFWLIVVFVLFMVWLLCSYEFKAIGEFWMRLFSDAKEQMKDDDQKIERLANGESCEEVFGWKDDEQQQDDTQE